jgi:SAM-dependent methyltransferase
MIPDSATTAGTSYPLDCSRPAARRRLDATGGGRERWRRYDAGLHVAGELKISTTRSARVSDILRPDAAGALEAWRHRVSANREQAERLREGTPPRDFYAAVASDFRANPRRTDEPALDVLRSLVQPGETWLDIGAGGGRYALPLALLAKTVIAVDPSEGMLDVLRQGMTEHGISNVEIVPARWPMEAAPTADVALMAHIGYDIEEIGPFLDGVEASARRLCVAVLVTPSPPYPAEPFWPPIHGEPRVPLPSLTEFLVLLLARGRLFELRLCERSPLMHADRDGPLRWLYQQLFVTPDTQKGQRLAALAREAITSREERWALSWNPASIGIVTWRPRD